MRRYFGLGILLLAGVFVLVRLSRTLSSSAIGDAGKQVWRRRSRIEAASDIVMKGIDVERAQGDDGNDSMSGNVEEPPGTETAAILRFGATKVYLDSIKDEGLISRIKDIGLKHEKQKPTMKSVRGTNHGGDSYHGSKSLQNEKDDSIVALHRKVEDFVHRALSQKGYRANVRVQQSWFNIQRGSGFNSWHGHRSGAQFTAVFYASAGPHSSLEVCEGPHTKNDGPAPLITPLYRGLLVAMPYFLRHHVPPLQDRGEEGKGRPRISVAFDLEVDFVKEANHGLFDAAETIVPKSTTIMETLVYSDRADISHLSDSVFLGRMVRSALKRISRPSFPDSEFLEWYASSGLLNIPHDAIHVKPFVRKKVDQEMSSEIHPIRWSKPPKGHPCSGALLSGVWGNSPNADDCNLVFKDRRFVANAPVPKNGQSYIANSVWRRPSDTNFKKTTSQSEAFLRVFMPTFYGMQNIVLPISKGSVYLFLGPEGIMQKNMIHVKAAGPACYWTEFDLCVSYAT